MSIIIVEGSDLVGKTTFAENLSKKTGYEIIKGSSFELSELGADAMFQYMMNLLDEDNIIVDRFFYSNLIYASIYDYPKLSYSQLMRLHQKMNRVKATLIYLHANDEVLDERYNMRGDDDIKSIEEIIRISMVYRQTMTRNDMQPRIMFSMDTSNTDSEELSSIVSKTLSL